MMLKSILFVCLFFSVVQAPALRIAEFYKDMKEGQWILIKSSDGLLTQTSVEAVKNGKVTMRIKSIKKNIIISDSEQVVDVLQERIQSIKIIEQGVVKEIFPEKTEMDVFLQMNFEISGEENIKIKRGSYKCRLYRGLYQDHVVKAWINMDIPVLHLVKMKTQGVTVQIVDYGFTPSKNNYPF